MISIIIILKNDRRIEKLLYELKSISKPTRTEVVVVDASEGKLNDIKVKFRYARWIYFDNSLKKKYSYSEQRNIGIRAAEGNIIVFIDSDCTLTHNWLVELLKPFEDKEQVVSGIVKSPKGKSIYDRQWDSRKNKYIYECGAVNLALTRSVINKVGFFDENLEAGEDLDYCWRIIDNGFRIKNNQNAIVYHDWGNLRNDIVRAFQYGKAKTRLYRKHFLHRWKNLFGRDKALVIYPTFILFLPLTYFFHFYPLLILIPILINFKKYPIKNTLLALVKAAGILKELFYPSKYSKLF